LKVIDCVERRGVEINPHARIAAARIGIETVASLAEVPDAYFDVAISNHALEHTTAPMDVVREIRAKLKPSGLAIFVVPCERYDTSYNPDDRDQHLYTWSPLNLGNMCRHAGFEVISAARFAHRWPPMLDKFLPIFGVGMSNVVCRIYARLRPKLTQVRVVGRKP
jgi:SAM-dependent methyltransferase